MILQKEFYFIRHGQTDHNISDRNLKNDHPEDIALNETGRSQAILIEPSIASLPIQAVCASPLKRVQETKEIITSNLQAEHHEINDLGECTAQIWKEMVRLGMYTTLPKEGIARQFMDRVRNGINQALSLPGRSLIVAHGGVHWALCCLMGIVGHEWSIGNCIPVHFSVGNAVLKILEHTRQKGVDVSVEAVGTPEAFNICQAILAPGGYLANIGVHGKSVDLHLEKLWDRNITLTTALVDTFSIPNLLRLVENDQLQPEKLTTHHFALADAMRAYEVFGHAAEQKALKVILTP